MKKQARLTKKAQKALRVAAFLAAIAPTSLWAQSVLENPGPGSFKSGISVVSGWKCTAAGEITVSFDNGPRLPVAYGTLRSDTAEVCGDTNNGFSFLWNYNLLKAGPHEAVMYDNGVEFARSSFTVTTYGDNDFLEEKAGEATINDFPEPGAKAHLSWEQATQGWVMDRYEPPTDSEDLLFTGQTSQGTQCSVSFNKSSSCHARFFMNTERTNLARSPRVEDVLSQRICSDGGAAYLFLASCGSSIIIGNFACGAGPTVTNGHWESHPRFSDGAYADIVADCNNSTCSGTYSTSGRPSPSALLCETGMLTWTASLNGASAEVAAENPPVAEQLQDRGKALRLEMTDDGFGHLTIPALPE